MRMNAVMFPAASSRRSSLISTPGARLRQPPPLARNVRVPGGPSARVRANTLHRNRTRVASEGVRHSRADARWSKIHGAEVASAALLARGSSLYISADVTVSRVRRGGIFAAQQHQHTGIRGDVVVPR